MRKYFGTDGVRGVANTELTCELAYRLGRAGGYVLGKDKEAVKVVVGRDTRVSGDMLESALIAGLMSTGCDVVTVGVLPTPAIAYITRKYEASCGVVISASHNPVEYNGIKFFNEKGFKLDDSIELEIEKYIDSPEKIDYYPIGSEVGKKSFCHEARKHYVEFVKEMAGVDLSCLKVVLDCANGAAFEVAPMVFEQLGAELVLIHNKPDGSNINDHCGSTHPQSLCEAVVANGADIGLAYDGDADRLIAVDEKGEIVDGDKIMLLGALSLKKRGMLKNDTLVITVMSNLGLIKACESYGINYETTAVGDRYVLEEMLKGGHSLGGEQSGHLIFLDFNTTGDGTLSSVVLAGIVKESGKSFSELASIMDKYPQVLVNVNVGNDKKYSYKEYPEVVEEIERIERAMEGEGRVLIRPSGTEPLVRVMIEGKEIGQITELAEGLAELIGKTLC